MTLSITHTKVSGKSDGADATLVQPSDWNAALTTSMATGKMLGRSTAGTGGIEEITPGAAFSLSGGNLQTVAMTGDVTTPANSFATTLANNAVTYAKLASAAVGAASDYLAQTASKVLIAAGVWGAVAETDGGNTGTGTMAPNLGTTLNYKYTCTGNFTLGVPTNAITGMTGSIRLIQDGTGSRTITYNAIWKVAGGSAASLSIAASSIDVLFYKVVAASGGTPSLIYYSLGKAFA